MSRDQPAQPELLNELLTAVRHMSLETMLLSAVVAERIGINPTDLTWLALIGPDGEVTAGELAELSGLTTGAVTGLIDRLERAGFVERKRDPEDRCPPEPGEFRAHRTAFRPRHRAGARALGQL